MKGTNQQYSFQRDWDGKVYQLTIHTSGDGYLYRKLDSNASGYKNVEELCGEYFCPELQTIYNIKIKDKQLIVEHFQNDDILLMRLDKDHYLGDKWWFFEIEFLRDENNQITGFRLNADEGHIKRLLFVRK